MTDISKEAVQRYSSSRNASGLGFSNGIVLDSEGDFVSHSDYAALQARVEELEGQTHDQFRASFDRGVKLGRLQGLDEAVEKLRRILGPNSAITARIKALKEQSND